MEAKASSFWPSMTMSYDQFANITSLSTSGTMAYADTLAPYTLTSYVPGSSASARDAALDVTYTASGKPKTIMNSLYTATLSYGPGDDRDGMVVKTVSGGNTVATRRYLAGCYEQETTSSGTVRRLWVGGDAYSAPVVLVSTNGGAWTAMAVGRDYLGSIIAVANASGTVVERNAWDPWGRAINPSNLTQYSAGSEPALALGRGFTGHEWLPWFSLWNANARIYDPLLGRFLSPDPYVQAPGFTQNFNRFAYCLNNPLKYTDESGEILHIIIGAFLGGVGNLIANWKSCEGFWEYLTSFAVGAAGGAVIAASGGAAAAAGGGFGATAGVIGVGIAGGAVNGATSDIIRQTGKNFEGIEDVDWRRVGINATAGGVAGGVGAGVGIAMSGVNIPIKINGTVIKSPILNSFVAGAAAGGAGHVTGGTTAGMLWGDSFGDAFHNSWDGIWSGILTGGAFSVASTTTYCLADGINPLNGRVLNNSMRIEQPAKNLAEQLVYEEAMNNMETRIIEAKDIGDYKWQGWDKMQYVHHNNNQQGVNHIDYGYDHITVHYFQKTVNGRVYKSGFKFKP